MNSPLDLSTLQARLDLAIARRKRLMAAHLADPLDRKVYRSLMQAARAEKRAQRKLETTKQEMNHD